MKIRNIVLISLLVICLFISNSIGVFSQGIDEIIEGEELPPRTRISILDVLYPKFTINDENVKILDKILSGDTEVLRTIKYKDYVDLLDLMNEYRYYILSNFTPNNDIGVKSREEITLYFIFRASYENAFVSFAYALYNPDEQIVINAYIHFKKLAELMYQRSQYITPLKKIFYATINKIQNDKVKTLHLKTIMVLERMEFASLLLDNPDLLSKIGKKKFRLIYAKIDDPSDIPPFYKFDESNIECLLYGLDNPYLSIVYACLTKLREIYRLTEDENKKFLIKKKLAQLQNKIEEYDLFLGQSLYEMASKID